MSFPSRDAFRPWFLALAGLALVLAGLLHLRSTPALPAQDRTGYLFCFWNAENFFDDESDGRRNTADREFDSWFARDHRAFEQKVKNLADVLTTLNGGRGPDILALAEVETERAAESLRDELNRRLRDGPPYRPVLMRNVAGGRHISPAILTRLPVDARRTRMLDKRRRILEVHIEVNGHDLVVLASHWTSRVSDKRGTGRDKYADEIYGRFHAMYRSNPRVDLLVCGDFNDNPDDPSVTEHLHATGDLNKLRTRDGPPYLYDLFANLWEENKGGSRVGTHFYRGHAFIFDQIVVSPGMLDDQGWWCEPRSAQIVRHRLIDRRGRPIPFGTEREKVPLSARGASDHLPVTVRLHVARGGW